LKRLILLGVVLQATVLLGCLSHPIVQVARRDLKPGTVIERTDFEPVKLIDVKTYPRNSTRQDSEVFHHRVLNPIRKGDVILTTELSPGTN